MLVPVLSVEGVCFGSLPLVDSFLVTPRPGSVTGRQATLVWGRCLCSCRQLWVAPHGLVGAGFFGASPQLPVLLQGTWIPAAPTTSCARIHVVTARVTLSIPSAHPLGSVGRVSEPSSALGVIG